MREAAGAVMIEIMARLRDETRQLHDRAEHGEFQSQLVKGALPKERYVAMLGQLFLIHRELESLMRKCRNAHIAFGTVLRPYQFQELYLREDLTYFGVHPESVEPLSATQDFIDQIRDIADACPVALLGLHYVFEGSNNGSRFIAKSVRRAYALDEDGRGSRYFEPYGDAQPLYWQTFKMDMASAAFSASEETAVVEAAKTAFLGTIKLHEALN